MSGNAVGNVMKIRGDLALDIANSIIKTIHIKYPNAKIQPFGSTGKKGKNQYSGDIDLGIELPYLEIENLNDWFVHQNIKTNILESLHILSIAWPIENHNFIQCDIMFVPNIETASFFYHSPDYRKNESKFKGLVRNVLMFDILKAKKVPNEILKFFPDGKLRVFQKYSIKPDMGIVLMTQSYEGKSGQRTSTKHTISCIPLRITKPELMAQFILGKDGTLEDTNSFESLWKYIYSHYDKKTISIIYNWFLEDLKTACSKDMDIYVKSIKWIKNFEKFK